MSHSTQVLSRRRVSIAARLVFVTFAILLTIACGAFVAPRATAAPVEDAVIYVVRAGDTLNIIAARYGVSVAALVRVNGIANPNFIYIGQRLTIPVSTPATPQPGAPTAAPAAPTPAAPTPVPTPAAPTPAPTAAAPKTTDGVYIVQRGDTLAKIAATFGVSISGLVAKNGIADPNFIWVGQRLQVTGVAASATTATTTAATTTAPSQPAPTAGGEKWIDVDLSAQTLTAFVGDTPVFSTLISGGLPDTPTVIGRFAIYIKLVSTRMTGPGYDLPNVPYTMYFYQGYGIHGTYWHNNFGQPMSHGCINMRTSDAAWLFNWAPLGTEVVTHW